MKVFRLITSELAKDRMPRQIGSRREPIGHRIKVGNGIFKHAILGPKEVLCRRGQAKAQFGRHSADSTANQESDLAKQPP